MRALLPISLREPERRSILVRHFVHSFGRLAPMTILKGSDIDAYIRAAAPARSIALVYGADAGLVSERVEAILRVSIDPSDPFALVRLAGDELAADPARLADEAQAIPMFGGPRLVLIRAGARSFLASVENLITAAAIQCRIIIEAGDLARTAPLRVLAERSDKIAALPCYADTDRDLGALVDEEMRQAGLRLSPDARNALLPLLGSDRRASRNELRKLALYAQGQETVELDAVLAVVADASALAVDAVVDAAFQGRPREMEANLSKALAAGTSAGTLLSAALRHVAALHRMRLSVDSGTAPADAIGPQIFFRRKPTVEAALRAWSSRRLLEAYDSLAQMAARARIQPATAELLMSHSLLAICRMQRDEA